MMLHYVEQPDSFHSFLSEMLKIQKAGGTLSFVRFCWKVLAALSKIHQLDSWTGVEILQNKTLLQALATLSLMWFPSIQVCL